MAGMWCSSCGQEIGHPEDDLHDPDNLSGIPESLGLGSIENEDAHVKVVKGPGGDGHRFMCRPSGKITKLLEHPPGEEPEEPPEEEPGSTPSGSTASEEPSSESRREPRGDEVYDLPEDRSPTDLVKQIVTNEIYGLNDGQIKEMQDWVNIYDGRIPPNRFEEILRDFDGVSKQKARLMRTKYEVMLDREIRRQADDRGPSIGATASAGAMPPSGGGPQGQSPAHPQPPPSVPDEEDKRDMDDLRKERRFRRVERRNDALDTAAEQFADAAAKQMAEDFGGIFGDLRDVLYTAFKKKAEKDPDWFFEKAEKWDLDILDTVLEPSESRKKELEQEEPDLSAVDSEIDEALRDLEEETEEQETPMTEEPQMDETEEESDKIELEDVMGGQ